MPDTFGLLQLPVPAPTDPRTQAVGDPLLDLVASYVKAVLNAELREAWAAVFPSRGVKGSDGTATSVPVVHTETFDPDEGAFTSARLPCLYVYRADSPEPQRIRTTQSWEVVRSPIALLLIPPRPTEEKQTLRASIRNAADKALRAAVREGRHPSWIVPGDTYFDPAEYGSVFLQHAKLQSWSFTGVKRQTLTIVDADGERDAFPGLMAGLLVDEQLERGTGRYAEMSHVEGAVTIGEGAIPFASYEVRSTLDACSPATGPAAGGTVVTLSGHQFSVDEDGGGLTVATLDGAALEDVELVDESTITARMPTHGAGPVGLVVTLPSGARAELAAAFTYL